LQAVVEAFLFDLDGTLVDTEILYVKATYQFLEEIGCPMPYEEVMELVYGRSWEEIRRTLVNRFAEGIGEKPEIHVRRNFVALRDSKDVLIRTSIDLLKRLAAVYPVGIVSGSPRQDIAQHIELMGIAEHLAFFLGAEDYYPGKPDPSCYLLSAEKLFLRPDQCLAFEDSQAGVLSAKSAGMSCVALRRSNGAGQDLSMADMVLSDLADFPVQRWVRRENV
jgi:beta-phosphoglucomutase-like phosphatase (HAD superfamily)